MPPEWARRTRPGRVSDRQEVGPVHRHYNDGASFSLAELAALIADMALAAARLRQLDLAVAFGIALAILVGPHFKAMRA